MDVYPTMLGLHSVTYYPESVSFALWNGETPRQRLSGEMRHKVRKWEQGM